ncbi:MAG TPA: hypothetical protein VMI55_05850 [Thermoplasmata archaeon]|nr:hypothetical protein [Thermoplasmata archaeon]
MGEPANRVIIVSRAGIQEVGPGRSAQLVRLERSVAWWTSLATWGALLLPLGALVGTGLGASSAIGGFLLFLVTAVAVGDERYELATALGVSAVIWTAVGVSVSLGADGSLVASLVGLTAVGALGLIVGVFGSLGTRGATPIGQTDARSKG